MNPETLPGTTDRRVAGLLRLLAQNATIVISGARIAREIGVSRSTVWRWVERLRELGVKVKGQAATGYFLEKVPDILTPDVLKRQLKGICLGSASIIFSKQIPQIAWRSNWGTRANPKAPSFLQRSKAQGEAVRGALGIRNALPGFT